MSDLKIHKFEVKPGPFWLNLPRAARVLDVQMQGDTPQMWVLLDPAAYTVERRFFSIGTGHTICGTDYDEVSFCGTFQMPDGLVFHVFENKP